METENDVISKCVNLMFDHKILELAKSCDIRTLPPGTLLTNCYTMANDVHFKFNTATAVTSMVVNEFNDGTIMFIYTIAGTAESYKYTTHVTTIMKLRDIALKSSASLGLMVDNGNFKLNTGIDMDTSPSEAYNPHTGI